MAIRLDSNQKEALAQLKSGKILCGGTGSGKSITGLAWYFLNNGGGLEPFKTIDISAKPLYIITTAKKRDSNEWDKELIPFLLYPLIAPEKHPDIVIDSWNNLHKYTDVKDAVFIFDEQRVVGKGAWVKAFLKVTAANEWILLTATPGDTWSDYVPVFIANGYFKNRTEFEREHVVWSRFSKYPKIEKYIGTGRLIRLRSIVLVNMAYEKETVQHHVDILCPYNRIIYKDVIKNRWDPYKDEPIQNASGLCYILRRIVNEDESRIGEVKNIVGKMKKVIIFYNYDYELDILGNGLDAALVDGSLPSDFEIAQWNGHKHQDIPQTSSWAYLVQYNAGAEGWNCTSTDTIIFYSPNYSYKMMTQAAGRIDRRNTPYIDLYYYHLKSMSPIDISIERALAAKENFNEGRFVNSL